MNAIVKFTDRKILNLKPKAERYTEWEGNGLGIRISPKGLKSWVAVYRFQGKPRYATLGRYPKVSLAEARVAHTALLAGLDQGEDLGAKAMEIRQETRKAPTVRQLAEEYLERHAKHKRTGFKDRAILERDVLPVIGHRKAKDIKRREIVQILDNIVDRGAPILANRTLEVVRKMYNWAIARDVVEATPCAMVKAPSKENRRERILLEDEIRIVWQGIDQNPMEPGTRLALKLALVTGQRRAEVAGLTWNELDMSEKIWTIPPHRSKNGRSHRVPLSSLAIEMLLTARQYSGDSAYVFPSPRRDKGDRPIHPDALTRAIVRLRGGLDMPHWTEHDLRRTAASYMTKLGASRLVVQKVLNHTERDITAVYDRHSYDDEKRRALEAWGAWLQESV